MVANISLSVKRDPTFVNELVAQKIRFVATSTGDPRVFTQRLRDAGVIVIWTATAEQIDAGHGPGADGSSLERVRTLYFDGDLAASVANTAQVAGRIGEIRPAADIIAEMWAGCRGVLIRTAQMEFPVASREV